MADYRLRTLGGLSLERCGQAVEARAAHRKSLILLAVLAAVGPEGMPRERVMALFWPESDTAHARGSLKQMMHALRLRLAAPTLFAPGADLQLDRTRLPSDVADLRDAIEADDDVLVERSYAGPFLDGAYVDRAAELEQWITDERTRLARRHLSALERLAMAAHERGDAGAAERWWWRLQMLEPLNSRFALGLMRAMEAAGDRPGALRHARNHVIRLRDELGVDADEALTTHMEQLRTRMQSGRQPVSPGAVQESPVDELVESGLLAQRFVSPGSTAAPLHLAEAEAWFTRALSIDPHHARALCGMGNSRYLAGMIGATPRDQAFAEGRRYIFEALSADDRCAEVHCSLGKLALYIEDDFPAAERYVRRALDLEPEHAEALRIQSIVLKILGRVDEAVATAREASRRLPEVPAIWNTLGDALLAAGHTGEAGDALQRAIALRAGYLPALERLDVTRRRTGDHAGALLIRRSLLGMRGEHVRARQLTTDAGAFGADGALRADTRRELEQLLLDAARVDPFEHHYRTRTIADRIVAAHVELEEVPKAMDWIEASYERRPGRLRRLLGDSLFDRRTLRPHPRYAALIRLAGTTDLL